MSADVAIMRGFLFAAAALCLISAACCHPRVTGSATGVLGALYVGLAIIVFIVAKVLT